MPRNYLETEGFSELCRSLQSKNLHIHYPASSLNKSITTFCPKFRNSSEPFFSFSWWFWEIKKELNNTTLPIRLTQVQEVLIWSTTRINTSFWREKGSQFQCLLPIFCIKFISDPCRLCVKHWPTGRALLLLFQLWNIIISYQLLSKLKQTVDGCLLGSQ